MEIILVAALVILAGWYIFFRQSKKLGDTAAPQAPYKVESPKVEETPVQIVTEEPKVVVEETPVAKPAEKKKAAKKTVAKATTAKTTDKKAAKAKTEKAKPVVKRVK